MFDYRSVSNSTGATTMKSDITWKKEFLGVCSFSTSRTGEIQKSTGSSGGTSDFHSHQTFLTWVFPKIRDPKMDGL